MAGHQAVGVEHQHVVVGAAPAGDEVFDVAGLAAVVLGAVAVEHPRVGPEQFAQPQERALLRDPHVRVGGVRQQEAVEMVAEAEPLHVLIGRLHGAEHAARLLVVDRHDDRGAARQLFRKVRARERRAAEQGEEADHAADERQRDPGEVDDEQRKQRPFEHGDAADLDHAVHLACAEAGHHDRPDPDKGARRPRGAPRLGPRARAGLISRPGPERLRGHRERRLRRHRFGRVGARGARRPPLLDHAVHR